MEKNTITEPIHSYNVNKDLIENITFCLQEKVRVLLSPELGDANFNEKISITITLPASAQEFRPITVFLGQYPKLPLTDKTESITIEVKHWVGTSAQRKAIYLSITFSREKINNSLQIGLLDEVANMKIFGIKEELYLVLSHYKNNNKIIYRNEYLPTIYFVGGFAFLAIMYATHSPILRPTLGILSAISLYFAAFRFVRGYCTFDTRSQRIWNNTFKWLSTGIAGAILAVVLGTIGKQIFLK